MCPLTSHEINTVNTVNTNNCNASPVFRACAALLNCVLSSCEHRADAVETYLLLRMRLTYYCASFSCSWVECPAENLKVEGQVLSEERQASRVEEWKR